jgi:quercetin dioxygenase-like cupin family protein
MNKKNITDLTPFYKIPLVEGRRIHASDQLEIVHLSIEPGGTMEPHTMPMNVLFYVLQGQGILDIDGVRYPLQMNEFIEVPKAAMRYWRNVFDVSLNLLVIKLILG